MIASMLSSLLANHSSCQVAPNVSSPHPLGVATIHATIHNWLHRGSHCRSQACLHFLIPPFRSHPGVCWLLKYSSSINSIHDVVNGSIYRGGDVTSPSIFAGATIAALYHDSPLPAAWTKKTSNYESLATLADILVSPPLLRAPFHLQAFGTPDCTEIAHYSRYCNPDTMMPYASSCEFSGARCQRVKQLFDYTSFLYCSMQSMRVR
jgi:hypothetical protein